MLSYETALLSKKKATERAEFMSELRQKWSEYVEFVSCLPDPLEVADMSAEQVLEAVESWGLKKSQLLNKSAGLHRVNIALVAAYQTKQAQWKQLAPLDEKVMSKDDVDNKKEEIEQIINQYEKALLERKGQAERKKHVADIGTSWSSYQDLCFKIQATFGDEGLRDLEAEEINELHEGWAEEKFKHQSQEASLRRVLLGLIDKCEVKEGSELLDGVVSKAQVEELQAKALDSMRIYERTLFQIQKAAQRTRDKEHAHVELQNYVEWMDEQVKSVAKSIEEGAGLDYPTLIEKNDDIAIEDERLMNTSVRKLEAVERLLFALESTEEEEKDGLIPKEEKDQLLAKNEEQNTRLEEAIKNRKRKFAVFLKEGKIQAAKDEYVAAFNDFKNWTQESSDTLDQTDMSKETISTLQNMKRIITENNDDLLSKAAEKMQKIEKLWIDSETLGIQNELIFQLDEVYEVEKPLKEAIDRRNETFNQLEKDLHAENIELLFDVYIEFVEKVHNDITASIVDLQLVENLENFKKLKKKAAEEDLALRGEHKKHVDELQQSAKILGRDGFDQLSNGEVNNVNESLALIHEAFQRGEQSTEQFQKAAKVFYATLADRSNKMEKRLKELEALEAMKLWNQKADVLSSWGPQTIAELSEKNDFGSNYEEVLEFERVLEKEERELEREIENTMREMEKLWEKN